MALPFEILLPSGSIVISISVSIQGFANTKGLSFGYVEQIYNGCLVTSVGDNVMYKDEVSYTVTCNKVVYRIIKESDIIFYEQIPEILP